MRSACGRLFFWIFNFYPKVTYRVYLPDSFYVFNKYPEAKILFERWIGRNRINNRGDLNRFYSLVLNLRQILDEDIKGDFAELGVYQGTSASILAHYADQGNKEVYLFDTFEGFDGRDLVGIDTDKEGDFTDTSYREVSEFIGYKDVCNYQVGYFPESLTDDVMDKVFSFVHLDCDLYGPMRDALMFFWPRLSSGGVLFLHDYSSGYWAGAKKAVDEFCYETGVFVVLLPDKSGSAVIRKNAFKAKELKNSLT